MSIRLRLTLLYSAILALTLVVFGVALYTVQAQSTMDSLKRDLRKSGGNLARSLLWNYQHPRPTQEPQRPPPAPQETRPGEDTFSQLREREIARVLNADGQLVASPLGGEEAALPLSAAGLQAVQQQGEWWEIARSDEERLLIYNRPVIADGKLIFIVQAARTLTEYDLSLFSLSRTLVIASLLTILAAFGIGWVIAGAALSPIHRITQAAQAIGNAAGNPAESDFSRRVDYSGPHDEIGQLATTFNSMLSRLQDAYQRMSHSLKMQRDFVADVSHELRTPLTTVRGNLALLRRNPPPPPEERADILTDLVGESDRLIRLVNDLLVLAHADAGRCLQRELLPVQPVVEEACRQARQLDARREIVADIQDVTALGDRDALKQVLLILLDNALKHSQGTIRVTGQARGEQVIIDVCDAGPGISSEALPHVFDRFYRGETDPATPGFGLGLPIAKALVEAQGGAIALESQPGCGTTVRIQLPRPEMD